MGVGGEMRIQREEERKRLREYRVTPTLSPPLFPLYPLSGPHSLSVEALQGDL